MRKYADLDLTKYFTTTAKWAECHGKLIPSTNNGIEATNAVIKEHKTLRSRLEIDIFLGKAFELVHQWSSRRADSQNPKNKIKFNETPKISLNKWTEAFQIAKKNSQISCKVKF